MFHKCGESRQGKGKSRYFVPTPPAPRVGSRQGALQRAAPPAERSRAPDMAVVMIDLRMYGAPGALRGRMGVAANYVTREDATSPRMPD